ncbi:MAG: pyridoxal phosphate-dependent aminotransferase [Oceanospirillaceae bacterium]|nr:pyridoxal phosphate-dependent aminotransferase [Oceanospirillaceae bacterium]
MKYPESKLPEIGTTIFTVMSQMAAEHGAINLAQGFPDFNGPKLLLDAVNTHVVKGQNQYAPMTGIPELREQIALKVERLYQRKVCAQTEVTVTSGATEAIYAAIASVVQPGDEVIVLDPAFDCYNPAIILNGAIPVHVQLQAPSFTLDWHALAAAVTAKTRLIIFNSPHNPSGAVMSEADLQQLEALVAGTDILLIGDDVYEHIIFDGAEHLSFVKYPRLYERSFVISSFGKTYHVTGWKIGYCVAPPQLTHEFRKVHQFLNFCTASPLQYALADVMREQPEHYLQLPAFYQQKRDLFNQLMEKSRFSGAPASGSYFQVLDYSRISDLDDMAFCEYLTKEIGVAAIPMSVFCKNPPAMKLVRFCFAKNDQTLREACEKLVQL